MATAVINNVPYDFADIEVDCGDLILSGMRGISFEHGMEREDIYGSAREPYDYTDGVYKCEDAELTLLESTYFALIDKLGNGYMIKRFSTSVALSHAGQPTRTYELQDCSIKKDAHDYSQGADGLEVSVTLHVRKCKVNGKDPVKAS